MGRFAAGMAMGWWLCPIALGFEEPQGQLERFLTKMQAELNQLPDYICLQNTERFGRPNAEAPWEKQDVLSFSVAMIGRQELYARPGDKRMQDLPLSQFVERGSVSSGQFGLMARHVFIGRSAKIGYRGDSERDGRRVHEYEYDVPAPRSAYRLRRGVADAVVAFQGSFLIDEATLDLLELEVQAYDIPAKVGLAQADTKLIYHRVPVGDSGVLLPASATLTIVAADGFESLNRTRLASCRKYGAESNIRFEGTDDSPAETSSSKGVPPSDGTPDAPKITYTLPSGTVLEVILDASLDPSAVQIGDVVKARVLRAVAGDAVNLPTDASITASVVRVKHEVVPYPLYDIGLAVDAFESNGTKIPLNATMVDVGPASGIVQQSKRMDPKFDRKAKPTISMLVRETHKGQGTVLWDARRGAIPKGLKMKWRVYE